MPVAQKSGLIHCLLFLVIYAAFAVRSACVVSTRSLSDSNNLVSAHALPFHNDTLWVIPDQTVLASTVNDKLVPLSGVVFAGTTSESPKDVHWTVADGPIYRLRNAHYGEYARLMSTHWGAYLGLKRGGAACVRRTVLRCMRNTMHRIDFLHRWNQVPLYDTTWLAFSHDHNSIATASALRVIPTPITPSLRGGGGPRRAALWSYEDLSPHPYVGPLVSEQTYRITGYFSAATIGVLPSNVTAVQVPLLTLLPRLSRAMLTDVAVKHSVTTSRRHFKNETLLALFTDHQCVNCGDFYTLFEPNETTSSQGNNRMADWRAKQSGNAEKHADILERDRVRKSNARKNGLFPPAPLTVQLKETVVRGFCEDTDLAKLQERGCAVCGTLTPLTELTSLKDIPYDLKCL